MKDSERQRIAMTQLNYPPGTRIVLNHMEDPYAPVPPGTRGTVRLVDDARQVQLCGFADRRMPAPEMTPLEVHLQEQAKQSGGLVTKTDK